MRGTPKASMNPLEALFVPLALLKRAPIGDLAEKIPGNRRRR
jgi:hypothetical protein